MSQIQYISVGKLDPHPDNPRKNLGDLTEIAASIKVNGIFQNLTVVPLMDEDAAPWEDTATIERYRIVIGHRRLAAAKLAGLSEVPCIVSDMTHAEQVRTMLMENLIRIDLTPYEQAEGFQMMLDLGDSLEDISTRTGFSESTVRRRVKLLELDSEKFKESSDRGATLFDYMELEKIKDIDKRNAVLEKAGTSNFNYELKRALDAQSTADKLAALIERLSAFATQIASTKDGNYSYVNEEFCDLLGVELLDSDSVDYGADTESARLAEAIAATPEKALLYAAYCDMNDSSDNTYYQHYHGTHSENESLDRLYDLLEVLGYKASDEEKAMRDGTHELFGLKAETEADSEQAA